MNEKHLANIFYFLCFATLVIVVILDFDNATSDNAQFIFISIAFIAYLIYLSGNIKIVYAIMASASACDAKLSGLFSKYIALPDDIKKIMVTEMNQYINIMKGMKDAIGKDPVEQLVDKDYYMKTKDPDVFVDGTFNEQALSNLQEDYFLIDKVFRDLQIADHELYMNKVYNATNWFKA